MWWGIWFNRGEEDKRYFLKRWVFWVCGGKISTLSETLSLIDRSINQVHLTAKVNVWIAAVWYLQPKNEADSAYKDHKKQKQGILLWKYVVYCISDITLCWETLTLFPLIRNCYLILSCHSDVQLHRGSTEKDENKEYNTTRAYFRWIRVCVLAWNLNPCYNIILFGTFQDECLSPLMN